MGMLGNDFQAGIKEAVVSQAIMQASTLNRTWNDPNSCSSCRASQGCGLMSLRAAVPAVRSGKRNSVPA